MRKRERFLIAILLIFAGLIMHTTAAPQEKIVYVIPIHGEIGPAVYQYMLDNLKVAEQDPNTVAVVFEIDTYGGRVDSAERMSYYIRNSSVPTISFVNTKAESAGVLLTISADQVAMAQGSTIGSAEPIPNTEKSLSYWVSELRTVAQQKGRDDQLVAAMADESIAIENVIESGRLLNLTNQEALKLGLADLVAADTLAVLEGLNVEYTQIINTPMSARVRTAQLATSSVVTPILLTLGFVGLATEVLTPGFGLGGTVSFIAFATYFGGSILAGNAGLGVIIIFMTGIALLSIEAFAPGFGFPGIGGLIAVITSIVLAANSVTSAAVSLTIAFVLTIVAIVFILKYAPRSKHFDRIVLRTALTKEAGYTSFKQGSDALVGKEGVAISYLRPSGTVEVEGERLDVVSEGGFIESGSMIRVVQVEGRRIVVRKVE
ncbi:protein of unknown function DUF107 [Alkaliphilus metalliredigens QYMF]|uniref:Uncharacterized protein n=1 Tax=Alkaliphilus metalliredigens (strain QYMF) TaxID=293826 RepID=A6TSL0_ALKMQ|nr:NfeD family protein [Alkaliphilus metalliredigens]ABR49178.1 protein of unknown function DUF107 [Alkaliphilus metalliredigens QYMF]